MIMRFLRRRTAGKNVTLRDAHNLVSQPKEARRGTTNVEARLETVLRNFCKGQGNTATIYVDGNYATDCYFEELNAVLLIALSVEIAACVR
ncbi:hypothetical protein JG688_00014134 [Phytophthora aleatoria]|uniref:Uncharacterized protein n=1 Tax=Phytophthora aleatoria TaxID=2496075 RepID=A0A8J5IGC8_9STRA|nr:hypothetical protein JG688_00014134 [Phytophthora aleatoria]